MTSRSQIESISRAAVSWYPASDGRLVARILGDIKIVLEQSDFSLTPHLVMEGFWESWVTAWCVANVQKTDRVLNIGANCGYFALLFARKAARVVAVEPQHRFAEGISRSAQLNGFHNLEVIECVAGSAERQVRMKLYDGLSGSAHVIPGDEGILVTERHASGLMPDATCVFIDAEGYEPEIWAGLQILLGTSSVRWIALEWAPSRYADAPGFLADMRTYGNVTIINHSGVEENVPDARLLSLGDGFETMVVRPRSRSKMIGNAARPPSTLRYFDCDHLPPPLQAIVAPFRSLAHEMVERGGDPAEMHAGLRKLLEAKDCAVRAMIHADPPLPVV